VNHITGWVLRRKAATMLITALVLVFGVFAVTQLKSELLPNVDFPYLVVTTPYPGASSDDVTKQVSVPVEAAVAQLPNLKTVRSISQSSYSLIVAEFNYGTDMKDTEQQLNQKLRAVSLPTGATGAPLQPNVSSINFDSAPIQYITVEGEQGQSTQALGAWANATAVPALSKVGDVGSVSVIGDTAQLVSISLRPRDLAAHGLSLTDVINTLKADNVTFPVGIADVGSQMVPVTTSASFPNAAALGDILLMPTTTTATTTHALTPTRLSDVATIQTVQTQPDGVNHTNGKAGVLLTVYKAQNGNTVAASDGVLTAIAQINQEHPDFKLGVVYDQADSIRASISGLVREGILGALFAVLVIFFFLRNVRSTLVTAISIPTSIVAGLILLWSQGITLNTLTLGALAIAVGRVVDDAIVVLENIFRHTQEGDPVAVAVREGTREVAGAITSSTITTVAVFLPLAFVGGITGAMFLPFALTVTFALLASLLVAVSIIPVFASVFITRKSVGEERENTLLQRIYTPILRWSLAHRVVTLGIAAALFVFSLASVGLFGVPVTFLPNSGDKLLNVTISTAPGADGQATLTATDGVEHVLETLRQRGTVTLYETTIQGSSQFARTQSAFRGSGSSATILVKLAASADVNAISNELRQDFQPIIPAGGNIAVASASSFSSNTLSYIVQGPDAQSVKQGSDMVVSALGGLANLANLKSDISAVTPQIVISPDPTKSPLANTALIGSRLRDLLQGESGGTITFSDGQQATLLVSLPGPTGTDIASYIATLKALPLTPGMTLGDVATVQQINATTQNTRINQALAATITADITTDNSGQVINAAQQKVAALTLPSGVTVSQSGAGQQEQEAFTGLAVAMLGAIALVYIVMVITFGSLIEPFAILFSLPLALIGALGALVITHRAIDISSMIGVLMLIGIVVTNAIVLMDLVNQLRRQGYGLNAALIQAGRTRVRPILMTAVATILALFPLALGFSEGSIIAADLGTVVIGGLLTSTLLTLVVVPVVYSLLEGAKARLFGTHEHPAPAPEGQAVPAAELAGIER
jgi:HAE1 family hydrophobic/amphiphilic exporter-1